MDKAGPKQSLVRLHHNAKEISFRHKYIIQSIFQKQINGILGIDYFSLLIIDSTNTLSCYSSMPALEFNLIHSDLWSYDGVFDLRNHKDGSFIFWDTLYPKPFRAGLKDLKQNNFGFKFGFFIMKKLNDIFVIYSFATRSQLDRAIYRNSKDTLFKIGDCFFDELNHIHRQYITREKQELPSTKSSCPLRLVIDNTKIKK